MNLSPRLLYPQERTPVPTEQEADWAPEPIWTFCRTEKSLASIKIRTPGLPFHSPVVVPTTLLRLDVVLLTLYIRKSKAVPLQAWSGPESSRKLSFPDFMTMAQDGGKVVSLMHRPPLPPGNTRGTRFC